MTKPPPPEPHPPEGGESNALLQYIDDEHRSIRAIAHDIASPLGILRLGLYFLQTVKPEEAKRDQYYETMGQAIDKLEDHIRRLRALTETRPGGTPEGEQQ